MLFSICKRFSALSKHLGGSSLLENSGLHCIRRNASSTFCCNHFRLFSDETSSGLSHLVVVADDDEKSKKSNVVKALLRDHGFNDTQILQTTHKWPQILSATEKNLRPKLEFLSSIGLSRTDLPVIISRDPQILTHSLENGIIPHYNYFKSLGFRDESVTKMLKNSPRILSANVETVLAPNVELLREIGVSDSSIVSLVWRYGSVIRQSHGKFKRVVDQVIDMGLEPSSSTFVKAVKVLCSISEDTWEQKIKLFRKYGFSDDQILSAFKRIPLCMALSNEKLKRCLDFLLGEFGWSCDVLVQSPLLLTFSLERRIVPRCHVMETLMKNGLVKKDYPASFLYCSDEKFLSKFISRYKDDFPELMDVYKKGGSLKKQS